MDFNNWKIQLRKGLLELVILKLLSSGQFYGYEMVKTLKTIKGFSIREGNIYPILARLKTDQLVVIEQQASPDGPVRNAYELTDAGRTMLEKMSQHWQEVVVTIDSLTEGGAS